MKTTCIAGDGRSGWANQAAMRAAALDPQALAEAAALRATGAIAGRREVTRLEPGEYPVVLAPAAVAEMLDWLAYTAFNGLAHAEGRGALVGRRRWSPASTICASTCTSRRREAAGSRSSRASARWIRRSA